MSQPADPDPRLAALAVSIGIGYVNAATVTLQDVQILAKVMDFSTPVPVGSTTVVMACDPSDCVSTQDAEASVGYLGDGPKAGAAAQQPNPRRPGSWRLHRDVRRLPGDTGSFIQRNPGRASRRMRPPFRPASMSGRLNPTQLLTWGNSNSFGLGLILPRRGTPLGASEIA